MNLYHNKHSTVSMSTASYLHSPDGSGTLLMTIWSDVDSVSLRIAVGLRLGANVCTPHVCILRWRSQYNRNSWSVLSKVCWSWSPLSTLVLAVNAVPVKYSPRWSSITHWWPMVTWRSDMVQKKKKKKISHRHWGPLRELIPLFGSWSRRGLNQLSQYMTQIGRMAGSIWQPAPLTK